MIGLDSRLTSAPCSCVESTNYFRVVLGGHHRTTENRTGRDGMVRAGGDSLGRIQLGGRGEEKVSLGKDAEWMFE